MYCLGNSLTTAYVPPTPIANTTIKTQIWRRKVDAIRPNGTATGSRRLSASACGVSAIGLAVVWDCWMISFRITLFAFNCSLRR